MIESNDTTVTVTVWHNVVTDFVGHHIAMMDGYQVGHPLVPVFTYTVPVEDAINHATVIEEAFHLFNVGDDPTFGTPDERAVAYRARRNRSLSVGDVVQVATAWWACASGPWQQIDPPAFIARNVAVHGTTPLNDGVRIPTPATAPVKTANVLLMLDLIHLESVARAAEHNSPVSWLKDGHVRTGEARSVCAEDGRPQPYLQDVRDGYLRVTTTMTDEFWPIRELMRSAAIGEFVVRPS
jgi:hypothetical protein